MVKKNRCCMVFGFHVAAVCAVVIQLNFQNDKLELLFRKNKYTVF